MADSDSENGSAKETPKADAVAGVSPDSPKVIWHDENMSTIHANVVNVVSSREEVMLFFGTNRTWNPKPDNALEVELSDRVIVNPHAAKRLLTLLAAVLAQYEKRHGKIDIISGAGGASGGD